MDTRLSLRRVVEGNVYGFLGPSGCGHNPPNVSIGPVILCRYPLVFGAGTESSFWLSGPFKLPIQLIGGESGNALGPVATQQ